MRIFLHSYHSCFLSSFSLEHLHIFFSSLSRDDKHSEASLSILFFFFLLNISHHSSRSSIPTYQRKNMTNKLIRFFFSIFLRKISSMIHISVSKDAHINRSIQILLISLDQRVVYNFLQQINNTKQNIKTTEKPPAKDLDDVLNNLKK